MSEIHPVPRDFHDRCFIDADTYEEMYRRSIDDGDAFWAELSAVDPTLPRWRAPEACLDLIGLILAWVYEQDHDAHVWNLDEVVRGPLRPALAKLGTALRQQQIP